MINNKDIYDKLEIIHGRINKVFGLTNENGKTIAVLAEHTKNQNTTVDKIEDSTEVMTASITKIEKETERIKGAQREHMKRHNVKNNRSWDRSMAKFVGMISVGTGVTIGIVFLLARLFLGI